MPGIGRVQNGAGVSLWSWVSVVRRWSGKNDHMRGVWVMAGMAIFIYSPFSKILEKLHKDDPSNFLVLNLTGQKGYYLGEFSEFKIEKGTN
jgi:hypothetical protein